MDNRQDQEGEVSNGTPKTVPTNYAPLKWKNYTIVPEWNIKEVKVEPVDGRGNRVEGSLCLLKNVKTASSKQKKQEFDVGRFIKYQEVKYRLFAAKRLEAIRHGDIKSKEQIHDEEILQEMISVYGEMDQNSDKFKKLFENYKESYLEQLEECEASESDKIDLVLLSGNPVIDEYFECTSKIYEEINWKFSKSEIKMFENLCPKNNESRADWLSLPRPVDKWEIETFDYLSLLPATEVETKPLNFNVLDPKYYEFPRWTRADDDLRMGAGICRSLNLLIHQFPCGITPDMFWVKFYEKHHYRIDLNGNSYGYRTLFEIFTSLTDVFYIVRDDQIGQTILFPASFNCQIAPMSIIRTRLAHLILQALSMSEGFLLVENVLDTVYKFSGVKFDCFNWGFNCVKEFVESYVKCVEDSVTIQFIRVNEKDKEFMEYYLVINSPFYMDTFNEIKTSTEKVDKARPTISNRTRIQDTFMGYYDLIEHLADHIYPGDTYRCVVSEVMSPFRFHLVLMENWNLLEVFQSYLQRGHWRDKKHRSENEIEQNLIVGLCVLCYTGKSEKQMEWSRGRIIQRLPGQTYRIWLVDYGTEVTEPFKNIRYLHKDLAAEEVAQAIVCQLRMPTGYEKYRKRPYWTSEHKKIFNNLFKKGYAMVKFHSSSMDRHTKTTKWEVSMSIADVKTNDIIISNVAQAFEAALIKNGLETGTGSVFKEMSLVWATAGK